MDVQRIPILVHIPHYGQSTIMQTQNSFFSFSKSAHSCFLPYVSRIRRIFLFLILKNDGWFKTIVCSSTNSTSTTQFVKNYKHLPILTAWYLVLNKTFSRNMSKPNSFTKLLYNLLNLLNDRTNSV